MVDEAQQDRPRFGRYRLDDLLGRGGMGEVWRAFDLDRRRTVAVKRLHAELADATEYQERFRREARLAARLRSPHVIPIHDFGEIEGRLFLDMRYVEGQDLSAHLARGRFPPDRAVAVIDQVAEALAEAHDEGLVHRDVKPSNVLLAGSSDFSYLVDFGIVRAVDGSAGPTLTATGVTIGTMLYMAPELLLADRAPDHRADVYALGCTLVETLTGRPPFDLTATSALMYHHVNVAPPQLSERGVRGFDDVVARAMAKRPEDRYDSVRDLAEDARRALGRPPRRTPPPPRPPDGESRPAATALLPARAFWRRPGVVAAGLGVVVLAASVATAIASSSGTTASRGGSEPETRPGFASSIEVDGPARARTAPSLGAAVTSIPDGVHPLVCAETGQVTQGGSGQVSTTWVRVDSLPSGPVHVPLVDVETRASDRPGPAESIRPC
ncbi:serine/threonine-protein kinase [Actinomycetospora termitidis]|uniref:non-specific serine/threonine protein kinase n=1 Tax=Actinomycetospora termitidis TaxID=3053470 RepID=A0ABT7MEG8_9PSEU|nr:serine/threonine-protein kinase [Actinomycetospora sp. Odt1-22]MDL5159054.1 serine/threonine-protein kinase [Actinomycetospora sp. Odt1-22]